MTRRFWLPVGALASFLSVVLYLHPLSAQETPPPDAPAPSVPAQETPPPDASAPSVPAQEPSEQAAPEPAATDEAPAAQGAVDAQQARAAFEEKFTEWKELLKTLRTLKHDYQLADEAGREALEQRWTETIAQAHNLLPALGEAGVTAFRAAPNEDRELSSFLVKLLQDLVANDRYEAAAKLGNALVDAKCDMPQIYREAGMANFAICDLEQAEKVLKQAEATNSLSGDARQLRKELESYKQYWKEEQELRQKEAAADDLPRVKLTTTKGDIVIELFENEAPNTVGNFISLVKKGFYDNLTFHRVISAFMAQGGCPEGDGTGGPGYSIRDEFAKPGARKHFRGSVSMANTGAPNSGGSQFFICFRPAPNLNGKHTVFGRVIEGLDVLEKLQRRNPEDKPPLPEPDKILKAEVLRDRGHEYLPDKAD